MQVLEPVQPTEGIYMKRPLISACVLILLLAGSVLADPVLKGKLAGLEFDQDMESARNVMKDHCADMRIVRIGPPNFPLARESEAHLVCKAFSDGDLSLDALALTFADDRLALIYARGDASALENLGSGKLEDWMQFAVSWSEKLVIDRKAGQAWIMSDESAHPNLFQWPDPYLSRNHRVEYADSATRPEALNFGGRLEDLQPQFEADCAYTHLAQYQVWLLNKPNVQQQLDCFGLEYAGFPRKVEAVFGDGRLQQAWILTGSGEEDRVRQALLRSYGQAGFVNEEWEIFDDGRVMLRKDKPEVLMLSDELAPLFRAEYVDGQD